jgi:BioD-like phosphotransacetylase family protein
MDIQSLFEGPDDSEILKLPRNKSTKRIFIAATRMNDGKTTTSLGLYSALNYGEKKIGYIKPVGQRFVNIDGEKIDEDSFLLTKTFDVSTPIQAMSPIVVDKDFTKIFLDDSEKIYPKIANRLCRSFDRAAYEKDYIIIEGTGHAGVGSVFNLSNAQVAKMLNAKVIIVASGGIGRPIDEIALNQALFEKVGADIIGVIINKVQPNKFDFIKHYCGKALKKMNLELLGVIPENSKLSEPSLSQIINEINGECLNSTNIIESKKIKKVIVGAKTGLSTIDDIEEGTLIISSADREDIIQSCIKSNKAVMLSGIILTGPIKPNDGTLADIQASQIPFILSNDNSYSVISRMNKINIKIQPHDTDKISIIKEILKSNVDLKKIEAAFELSL